MKNLARSIIIPVCVCFSAFGQNESKKLSISDLKWLAGCWENTRGNRSTEEFWTKPTGGIMLGVARTTVNGKATEYEFMRIHEENGGILFTAKPSGQAEASFKLVSVNQEDLIFENPQHDFPQRVIYRSQADVSLLARIEGEKDGRKRSMDFPYKRTKCE